MNYINAKSVINNEGKIIIPENMLKKLGIKEWDVLQITATDNLIIIEKCEEDDKND